MDPLYDAFIDELEKLAAETTRSRGELARQLEPGDVLITTNAPTHHGGTLWGRIQDRILKTGIRTVYGDAGHAAIYVGDGKTVEMSNRLKHWTLDKTTKGKDVHVFRPDAPLQKREAVAAALVKKVEENGRVIEYVPPGTLAKALVEEFVGRRVYDDKTTPAGEGQRYTCTNVIAAAYKDHGVDLVPNKTVALVSPTDFITSKKTTKVLSYFNPKRHDKHQRRGIKEHEKAAEDVSTVSGFVAQARPGDVILTSQGPVIPDPNRSAASLAIEKTFDTVNRWRSGVDNTHSSMYVGGGKAVELVSSGQVRLRPVQRVVTVRDAKLIRPNVTAAAGRAAAKKMLEFAKRKDEIGYASKPWLGKLLLSDTPLRRFVLEDHDSDIKQNKAICSNLVSKAYDGVVDFHDEKPHGYITPRDILESKNTSQVAKFINKRRWDAERRSS